MATRARVAATRPRGPALSRADFFIDQREEGWNDQSEQQEAKHDGIEDEDNVPGVPLLGERPERANTVVVGEIEQDVAETGKASIEEK